MEANTCDQFLLQQIDVVQPQVIVALGATAAMYLLGVKQSLSSLRGRWHSCRGAKLAVTYHPAFLLRDPRQKGEAWKDLQMVMAEMGLKAPAKDRFSTSGKRSLSFVQRAAASKGRKSVKTVPLCPSRWLLRTLSMPL